MGNPGQGLQNQAPGQAIEDRRFFIIRDEGRLTENPLVTIHR
jgi:hypothetical protein